MGNLTGKRIDQTYDGLIKTSDEGPKEDEGEPNEPGEEPANPFDPANVGPQPEGYSDLM